MKYKAVDLFQSLWPWLTAAIVPTVLFLFINTHYLPKTTFSWLCLVTLPFSVAVKKGKGFDFFLIALLIALLTFFLPNTIGVYLILSLTLIVLLQSIVGQLQPTILVHALLASPLFTYFNSLVSFPIRLQLSKIVSHILNTAGYDVQIDGNLVSIGDASFLVDEACSGMFMLGYGLLFGTIILSTLSKKYAFGTFKITFYYFGLLALIFSGNIARIIILILFSIGPDHWLHEFLGLVIFLGQILIPFYVLIITTAKRQESAPKYTHHMEGVFPTRSYSILFTILLILFAKDPRSEPSSKHPLPLNIPGYTSTTLDNGVTKLQNEKSLIYFKPPVSPYRADHNPMICWQGSGYKFKKIEKYMVGKQEVNLAELVLKKDKIYTAWWFESTNNKVADQWTWRKISFLNDEDFYLINISCNTRNELIEQSRKLIALNTIATFNK